MPKVVIQASFKAPRVAFWSSRLPLTTRAPPDTVLELLEIPGKTSKQNKKQNMKCQTLNAHSDSFLAPLELSISHIAFL